MKQNRRLRVFGFMIIAVVLVGNIGYARWREQRIIEQDGVQYISLSSMLKQLGYRVEWDRNIQFGEDFSTYDKYSFSFSRSNSQGQISVEVGNGEINAYMSGGEGHWLVAYAESCNPGMSMEEQIKNLLLVDNGYIYVPETLYKYWIENAENY